MLSRVYVYLPKGAARLAGARLRPEHMSEQLRTPQTGLVRRCQA